MNDSIIGLIDSGLDNQRFVIMTGRKSNAINISTERIIRKGYIRETIPFSRKIKVFETLTYEMACDFPRTDNNFFGQGEYYAETETTGAWWLFDCVENAKKFMYNH